MLWNNAYGIQKNLKCGRITRSNALTFVRIQGPDADQDCIDLQETHFQHFLICGSFTLKVKDWPTKLRLTPHLDPDTGWATAIVAMASTSRPKESLLDIAAMTKGVINIFEDDINPTEYLSGLEAAVRLFGKVVRATSTINTKRKGSFDCS